MRHLMMAGASILALGMTPALAQKAADDHKNASAGMQMPCPAYTAEQSGARSDDILDAIDGTGQTASAGNRKDGSVRDAMGDEPVNPGASARAGNAGGRENWSERSQWNRSDERDRDAQASHEQSFEDLAEKLPVPSVSDGAMGRSDQTGATQADAAEPRESAEDRSAEDFSDIIDEGDRVPQDIGKFEDDRSWNLGAGPDQERVNRQDMRDRNQQANAGRSAEGERARDGRTMQGDSQSAMQDRDDRQSLRQERRRQFARLALRSARFAVPNARFDSYEFKIEDQERVIELAGRDLESGRRVEVDVYPAGRIQSIDQYVPLDAVPESVRKAVRDELGRYRVAHTKRSLTRDLDIYYEFAGFSRAGVPLAVRIRADGEDLAIRRIGQS